VKQIQFHRWRMRNKMKLSPEYLRWYRETRCQHGAGTADQCKEPAELHVDREAPLQKVNIKDERSGEKRTTLQYPTYRGTLCYYHRKKKEGLFNNTADKIRGII
jgi:hypothetical protein